MNLIKTEKPWFESRTIILMIFSIAMAVLAEPHVLAILPLSWMPAIQALIAVIGIILRFRTDEAIKP